MTRAAVRQDGTGGLGPAVRVAPHCRAGARFDAGCRSWAEASRSSAAPATPALRSLLRLRAGRSSDHSGRRRPRLRPASWRTRPSRPRRWPRRSPRRLQRAAPVDLLVDLNLDDATPTEALRSWRAALTQTVAAVQSVYDDWAAEGDARRCGYLAVTRLGGRMGYDGNGIRQPLGGIWAGFAKSLPYELPACRIKVLDVAGHDSQCIGRPDFAGAERLRLLRGGLARRGENNPRMPQRTGTRTPTGPLVRRCGAAVGRGTRNRLQTRRVAGLQPMGAMWSSPAAARCPIRSSPGWRWTTRNSPTSSTNDSCRPVGADLGAVRRENTVLAGDRESAFNLAEARRRGLPITTESATCVRPTRFAGSSQELVGAYDW